MLAGIKYGLLIHTIITQSNGKSISVLRLWSEIFGHASCRVTDTGRG